VSGLLKFNGIPKHTFHLHLKETEFRNHHQNNLYKTLLFCLRNNPL
jgi:transposase-like protein